MDPLTGSCRLRASTSHQFPIQLVLMVEVMDVVEVVGRGVPLVPLVTGTDLPKATVVPQKYCGRLAS